MRGNLAGVKGKGLGNEEAVWGLLQHTCTHKLVCTHIPGEPGFAGHGVWAVPRWSWSLLAPYPGGTHTFPTPLGREMGEGREGQTGRLNTKPAWSRNPKL